MRDLVAAWRTNGNGGSNSKSMEDRGKEGARRVIEISVKMCTDRPRMAFIRSTAHASSRRSTTVVGMVPLVRK